jgi:asparagine synthase (glutamine-hydrolysing)
MSVQFGRWNLDGSPIDSSYIGKVNAILKPYGPDGSCSYKDSNVHILYHTFDTTAESHEGKQPFSLRSDSVIAWDGRLDNRGAIVRDLRGYVAADATEVEIVEAAYKTWGHDCFGKLIGDWAFSAYDPKKQELVLAKDFLGSRHLFYSADRDHVVWSTILEPLILLAGRKFKVCEEYVAGLFGALPASHLSPYEGILGVPPASLVVFRNGNVVIRKYWDFNSARTIRYRSDSDYEAHFRAVFVESVRRRLRSHAPVLAELSGGMDSSAIVCVADRLIADGATVIPRVDTVSYIATSEPHWNEEPYFQKVEQLRGRAGLHLHVDCEPIFPSASNTSRFAALPGSVGRLTKSAQRFDSFLTSQGSRVLISGIGGDEVMGGVPTSIPELADLFARGRLQQFARRVFIWALARRKPIHYLTLEVIRAFLPTMLVGFPEHKRPAPWLQPAFLKRQQSALSGYDSRLKLFGPLPSIQENLASLESLRRQVAGISPPMNPCYDMRYPYLDRDLLEFIYSIPREQLVRPHQRRSLMRRALVGIVPDEVLSRKRKAYVVRGPTTAIAREWTTLYAMTRHMVSSALGFVDQEALVGALEKARYGNGINIVGMLRTVSVESWLQELTRYDVLQVNANHPSTMKEREMFGHYKQMIVGSKAR